MADKTKIEWTDATWNIITGCTLVDEGCRHCYAARLAATRLQHHPSRKGLARLNAQGEAKFTGEVRFNDQWLDQPLRWKTARRIFVCAHGDLFHESVPDDWIDKVFAVMALAPQHTFQVLTKRPVRMRAYFEGLHSPARRFDILLAGRKAGATLLDIKDLELRISNFPLPNVWLGTSVSDQVSADLRIPDLLATPAAVRFLSAEPLLGAVDLWRWMGVHHHPDNNLDDPLVREAIEVMIKAARQKYREDTGRSGLNWVICGGESGPNARPMHPDWARSLRDQSQAAGVAFFFKQWGEWASGTQIEGMTGISSAPPKDGHFAHPHRRRVHGGALDGQCFQGLLDDHSMIRVGKAHAGRLLDGQEWSQMPGVVG